MVRSFLFLLLSTASLSHAQSGSDLLDPAFQSVPFDRWLAEPGNASFRWSLDVPHAELSFHQRLLSRVVARVDGRDLQSRPRNGRLEFFFQVTTAAATRYQNHFDVELSKLDPDVKSVDLEFAQAAFFLPGEYRLALLVLDTATGEHSARQAKFRISGPHNEFFADAWRALPPVEFIPKTSDKDDLYLPGVRGHLEWAASLHSPARLDVLLTEAPSSPDPRLRATHGDVPALIPTLKVLSESGSPSLSQQIEILDLARRRAVFHQSDVHELDWPALNASLSESTSASIDVHSLSDRHRGAQFFVSEVRQILRASESPSVLVVLTKSLAFEPGEDLSPISIEALPACRVVYIRYHDTSLVRPLMNPLEDRTRGGRFGGDPMGSDPRFNHRLPNQPPEIDQLEPTLKPLNPRIYDVQTAEQMAKALSEIQKLLEQ